MLKIQKTRFYKDVCIFTKFFDVFGRDFSYICVKIETYLRKIEFSINFQTSLKKCIKFEKVDSTNNFLNPINFLIKTKTGQSMIDF